MKTSFSLSSTDTQLIRAAQAWALADRYDPIDAGRLRHRTILSNHAHYLDAIPAYRRFAQEEGIVRAHLSRLSPGWDVGAQRIGRLEERLISRIG